MLRSTLPLEAMPARKPADSSHPRIGIELALGTPVTGSGPYRTASPIPDNMASSGLKLAARSLQFIRPFRRSLVSVVVLGLILATLSAVDPLLMKYLFDQLGRAGGGRAFALAMAGLLAMEVVRAGLQRGLGVRSWDVRLRFL